MKISANLLVTACFIIMITGSAFGQADPGPFAASFSYVGAYLTYTETLVQQFIPEEDETLGPETCSYTTVIQNHCFGCLTDSYPWAPPWSSLFNYDVSQLETSDPVTVTWPDETDVSWGQGQSYSDETLTSVSTSLSYFRSLVQTDVANAGFVYNTYQFIYGDGGGGGS